jgi:hypothetical protein
MMEYNTIYYKGVDALYMHQPPIIVVVYGCWTG